MIEMKYMYKSNKETLGKYLFLGNLYWLQEQ